MDGRDDRRSGWAAAAGSVDDGVALTAHARQRLAQRCFSERDLSYVLDHGAWLRRTGVDFCFLRRRDIPSADRRTLRRLEGTVILVADDGTAITAYRDRQAPATIRRKAKYRRPPAPWAGSLAA